MELKKAVVLTVKRHCKTRWSSKAEAAKAVYDGLENIVQLLEDLSENREYSVDTRYEATSLVSNILNFDFLCLLPFWYSILQKIDRVQKRLQDPEMNFHGVFLDIEALHNWIIQNRDLSCNNAMKDGTDKYRI